MLRREGRRRGFDRWCAVGRALPLRLLMHRLLLTHASCPFFAADVLSAVEFDHTGQFLATGDKGGRVVIFENAGEVRALPACNPSTVASLVRPMSTAVI